MNVKSKVPLLVAHDNMFQQEAGCCIMSLIELSVQQIVALGWKVKEAPWEGGDTYSDNVWVTNGKGEKRFSLNLSQSTRLRSPCYPQVEKDFRLRMGLGTQVAKREAVGLWYRMQRQLGLEP